MSFTATPIKTEESEFVEVITMTDLLNSNSTDPFSNVVTERSLLDERPLGEEVKESIA